jgi:antitoxin component HigA of HigAB toxin-antitoxin module
VEVLMVFLSAVQAAEQRNLILSLISPLQEDVAFPSFADYVRNRIAAHSTSARALSRAIGMSHNYISNCLHRNQQLSGSAVVRIARYFGDEPALVLKLAFDTQPDAS